MHMKQLFTFFLIFSFFLSLFLPGFVSAHGSTYTLKYVDGPNMIILTNNVHDVESGIPVSYNLRMYDTDGKPVTFTNVQFIVKKGINKIAEQTLPFSSNGDATAVYTFPKQGEYMLYVQFNNKEKQIAQGEFPVIVEKGIDENFFTEIVTVPTILAFLLGMVAMKYVAQNPQTKILASRFSKKLQKKKN